MGRGRLEEGERWVEKVEDEEEKGWKREKVGRKRDGRVGREGVDGLCNSKNSFKKPWS